LYLFEPTSLSIYFLKNSSVSARVDSFTEFTAHLNFSTFNTLP